MDYILRSKDWLIIERNIICYDKDIEIIDFVDKSFVKIIGFVCLKIKCVIIILRNRIVYLLLINDMCSYWMDNFNINL